MDGQAAIDLERPRSIPQLIGASVDLYFRVPVLFLALAAVVVVPWEFVVAGSITSVLWLAAWHVIGHEATTVGSFAVGTALQIVMRSFEALVLALLYFDLKGRQSIVEVKPDRTAPTEDGRAAGWYIDPSMPTRMRYWAADGTGWSKRTTKTPKQMLREWQEQHRAEVASTAMAAGEHTGHSLDPDVYTDEGRPAEKTQSEWRDLRWRS